MPFFMTLFVMIWPMAMLMEIVEETNYQTIILDAEEIIRKIQLKQDCNTKVQGFSCH
jgi:hypothetical protein